MKRGRDVLMSQRKGTKFMDGWYTLPAGHVRPGETMAAAAVREAKEEADVTILEQDVNVLSIVHRRTSKREYMDCFVQISRWQGEVGDLLVKKVCWQAR